MLQSSSDQKLQFAFLKNISGADSNVEIIDIEKNTFVLKTYTDYNDKVTAIVKRNREHYYQHELKKLNLLSLEFKYLNLIKSDQLCMNFISDLKIFNELDNPKYFQQLGIVIKNLIDKSQSKSTKLVTEKSLETKDKNDYFEWLKLFIKTQKLEKKYLDLGLKLIEELNQTTEYLTLLHSDFHTNNIGLTQNNILLFDSGDCPYLFGHKYHDLTRILMYNPDKIIFGKLSSKTNTDIFLETIGDFSDDWEFLKFCYIQSLLIYNNPFVTDRKQICEYLFSKLSFFNPTI